MLYFAFNIGCSDDNSGLPTYCEYFLNEFKIEKISVINIIYDRNVEYRIEKRDWNGNTWFNCYLPLFLEKFYDELLNVIEIVIQENSIKNIIMPDYLLQEYFEKIDLKARGITKTLFIHLLYRGMMDCFTKQPYFEHHILDGMQYLSTVAFREWKAIMTSDIIICNSNFTKRQLEHFYWDCKINEKIIIEAPLGVNKESIPFQPANKSTTWAYFGRFETQKGLVYLGKDFKCNPDKYRENPLKVYGSGSMDTMLLKAHHFDGLVEYKGNFNKQDLWEALKDIKYCIFPSIYEPFGLALTEALAMGKICIVNNCDSGMTEQYQVDIDGNPNMLLFDFTRDSIVEFINHLNTNSNINYDAISKFSRDSLFDIKNHFKILRDILI